MKKNFSLVKSELHILPAPMKAPQDAAEVFAEYLSYWMEQCGMDSRAVVQRAKRRHGQLSEATMHNLLAARPSDMMVRTVEVLAHAIRRPPEEVFMAKLGHARIPGKDAEAQPAELGQIERRLSEMPHGEFKRHITRFIRMIEHEIEEHLDQADRK